MFLVTGISLFYFLVVPIITTYSNPVIPVQQPPTVQQTPLQVSQVINNLLQYQGQNVTITGNFYKTSNQFITAVCFVPELAYPTSVGQSGAGYNLPQTPPVQQINQTSYEVYGGNSTWYYIYDPNTGQKLDLQMVDQSGSVTYTSPNVGQNHIITITGILKVTSFLDCGPGRTVTNHLSAIFNVGAAQLGVDPNTLSTSKANVPFIQNPSNQVKVLSVMMSPALPQVNQSVVFDFKIQNISTTPLLFKGEFCGPAGATGSINFDNSTSGIQIFRVQQTFFAVPLVACFPQQNYNVTSLETMPGGTADILLSGSSNGPGVGVGNELLVSNYGTAVGHYSISNSGTISPFSVTGTVTVTTSSSSFTSMLSLIPKLCWACLN